MPDRKDFMSGKRGEAEPAAQHIVINSLAIQLGARIGGEVSFPQLLLIGSRNEIIASGCSIITISGPDGIKEVMAGAVDINPALGRRINRAKRASGTVVDALSIEP